MKMTLAESLFLIGGMNACTFIRLCYRCFQVNLAKFLQSFAVISKICENTEENSNNVMRTNL